jgi:CheY-like chemotaxis protein
MVSAIVIDDDKDVVESFASSLEYVNVKVVGKGYDGKEAVELYQKLKPDFVVLDILMPEYDGHYAIENIRKFNPNAKIFVITADVSESTTKKLTKAKVDFMQKPFKFDNIIKKILLLD